VEGELDLADLLREVVKESGQETVDLVIEHELGGVKPEMIDWWWGNIDSTERYRLWHPQDHLFFEWEVPPTRGKHLGSIHVVVEKFGDTPPTRIRIRSEDPASVPVPTTRSHVFAGSVVDREGKPLLWIVHEYEEAPYGTKMRSTFRLPAKMPSFILEALRRHNREEMEKFTRFLPELYRKHL